MAALPRNGRPDALQQLALGLGVGRRLMPRRAGDAEVRQPFVQRARPHLFVRDRAELLDIDPRVGQGGAQMGTRKPANQRLVERGMERQQRRGARELRKRGQRGFRRHALALALRTNTMQQDVVARGHHRLLPQHHLKTVAGRHRQPLLRPVHPQRNGRDGQQLVALGVEPAGFDIQHHPA